MKQVGILTFQFAHNYGAILQAFALKQYLEEQELNVIVVNYLPHGLYEYYSLNPISCIKRKDLNMLKRIPIRFNQAKKFLEFQNNYLKLGNVINHVSDDEVKDLDAIIVGSDQVWNKDIVPDLDEYLLAYYNFGQKFAYSASFGKYDIPKYTIEHLIHELPKFSGISIREESTSKLVNLMCNTDTICTVDPVLLYNATSWRNIYSQNVNLKEDLSNFILYIDLFNDKTLISKAEMLSKETGYKVYAIHPMCKKADNKEFINLRDVGPLDYLCLIDNASYIVSNSFHGVAFSYIFEKKLVFYLNDALSNRIDDFLRLINVENNSGFIDFAKDVELSTRANLNYESKLYLHQIVERIKECDNQV